jgi:hypothetical protein
LTSKHGPVDQQQNNDWNLAIIDEAMGFKHHKDGFTLWLFKSLPWKITMLLIGKPSINGPFSMAMLNNQRVTIKHMGIHHQHDWKLCRKIQEFPSNFCSETNDK